MNSVELESAFKSTLAEALHDHADMLKEARFNHCDTSEGPTLESSFGPGTFGAHEALDRAHLIRNTWADFMEDHPTILLHPELFQHARVVGDLMDALYHEIGVLDERAPDET
ncbi:hypothetical protein [Stratiformator vulcanicus]|uniref:Uncharacterized protein n=1 Tax=Stratiformator vulcanicus TaxID=2527980 RepID=A0A517R3T2_9PLAN|nr:hypothetical protein [Stratiformator vulcanicus]QDT38534.1 hypothetical protein Pan189_29280 [Stratiformator vulcanicus]